MVWLTGLLTAILVLSADWAIPETVDGVAIHMLTGLGFLLLAPGFALFQSRVTKRRWTGRNILEPRSGHLQRRLFVCNFLVWLVGCVALLVVAKWPGLIRENWQLDQLPLLDELALALPMIGSALLSWVAIFDAESAIQSDTVAERRQRFDIAWQRLRTLGGLVLFPIAILFLGRDVIRMMYPEGIGELAGCLLFMTYLVLLLAAYPVILAFTWKTCSVSSQELSDRLVETGREAGLPGQRFVVWDTGRTIVNAVVVGVVPCLRRIFLTDHLLDRFDDDEVVAIYRHELGHVVHHHVHMRIALVLVPLFALLAIAGSGNTGHSGSYQSPDAWISSMVVAGLGLVALVVYATVVVARFVRKSEIEADMFAVSKPNGEICPERARTYCRALLKMGAHAPELFERSTVAHPSIKLRIEVIRQALTRPEAMATFRRRYLIEQRIATAVLLAMVVLSASFGLIA